MGKARGYCYKELLPFGAMFAVECTNVGLSTIFKAATLKGLSYHVFMVYSYGVSALVLLPLCLIFYRKMKLPPLTFQILARFFSLGIMGFSAQYLGYRGIEYSSPTLASAMSTLAPAATFVLAVLFRMEKLELNRLRSQLKTIGTIITIAGAFVVVLYKGPVVIDIQSSSASTSTNAPTDHARSDWVMGGVLLAANYLIVSVWYIFQAKAVNEYPAEIVVVFFYNLFSCIIATPVCFITEPNLNAWILTPDVRLMSILYSGIIGSGFGTVIHTWGLHVKGPVYVALFRPLSIAIAAILGVIFLGDNLYLGSIIGAIIISSGFYIVVWGKSQEETVDDATDTSSEDPNVPLLA